MGFIEIVTVRRLAKESPGILSGESARVWIFQRKVRELRGEDAELGRTEIRAIFKDNRRLPRSG